MSESNDLQRFEALESNVTEIQGQMSELMSMMRQLTQTRTTGVGQREEESGGTGRGAAHNYSGGAEGCRPLLTQVMVLQQSELQQPRRSPSTAGRRQNQESLLTTPAGDQCFQLEWAR